MISLCFFVAFGYGGGGRSMALLPVCPVTLMPECLLVRQVGVIKICYRVQPLLTELIL